MLDIFYNYAVQAHVSARNGIICPPLFCFADYVECRLTVFDLKMARMDLSHVVSWGGAIDVDEDSDTEPLVRILPGLFDASGASNGEIRFPTDCNTINFQSGVSKKTTGSLEIYGYDSSDRRVIRVKIPVELGLPNDLPGDHEPDKVPPSAVRTLNGLPGNVEIVDADGNVLDASDGKILVPSGVSVNGLSGAVVLTDADGNAFETSGQTVVIETGGALWDYSAVTWPAVQDATYGRVRYLDAVYPELFFAEIQDRVNGFRALVVSNDNTVSGNMALIPVVATDAEFSDAIELPAQILAVGTSLAEISFDLEINRKFLKFRRDYENPLDTLKDVDGVPLTAIITELARRISNA